MELKRLASRWGIWVNVCPWHPTWMLGARKHCSLKPLQEVNQTVGDVLTDCSRSPLPDTCCLHPTFQPFRQTRSQLQGDIPAGSARHDQGGAPRKNPRCHCCHWRGREPRPRTSESWARHPVFPGPVRSVVPGARHHSAHGARLSSARARRRVSPAKTSFRRSKPEPFVPKTASPTDAHLAREAHPRTQRHKA